MKITQTRVKQYNSTYKTVIAVDGVPYVLHRVIREQATLFLICQDMMLRLMMEN